MIKTKFLTATCIFFCAVTGHAQTGKTVTEYLNLPGPIVLNSESFNLNWSSHPSADYYKQEYLGLNDKTEKYKKMVMAEVLTGTAKAADLAKAKIAGLQQMQKANPVVKYEMFQKNGEIMIDFLVSENSADGRQVNIIERNVYRYRNITDTKGKKGVMLFAVSERAYGNEVDAFLVALKKNRPILMNAVAAFVVPQITIKN